MLLQYLMESEPPGFVERNTSQPFCAESTCLACSAVQSLGAVMDVSQSRSVSAMLINRYTRQRELCWPFTFRKQRHPCVPKHDPANSRIGVRNNLSLEEHIIHHGQGSSRASASANVCKAGDRTVAFKILKVRSRCRGIEMSAELTTGQDDNMINHCLGCG